MKYPIICPYSDFKEISKRTKLTQTYYGWTGEDGNFYQFIPDETVNQLAEGLYKTNNEPPICVPVSIKTGYKGKPWKKKTIMKDGKLWLKTKK